jgi:hypothetical protein
MLSFIRKLKLAATYHFPSHLRKTFNFALDKVRSFLIVN